MFEEKLFASNLSDAYSLGTPDGPDLVNGQALAILLGGHWITGRVKYSADVLDAEGTENQREGTYHLGQPDKSDTINEASEESFPASDAPAWSLDDQTDHFSTANKTVAGYYFVADADQSICGLCVGMQVRQQ